MVLKGSLHNTHPCIIFLHVHTCVLFFNPYQKLLDLHKFLTWVEESLESKRVRAWGQKPTTTSAWTAVHTGSAFHPAGTPGSKHWRPGRLSHLFFSANWTHGSRLKYRVRLSDRYSWRLKEPAKPKSVESTESPWKQGDRWVRSGGLAQQKCSALSGCFKSFKMPCQKKTPHLTIQLLLWRSALWHFFSLGIGTSSSLNGLSQAGGRASCAGVKDTRQRCQSRALCTRANCGGRDEKRRRTEVVKARRSIWLVSVDIGSCH